MNKIQEIITAWKLSFTPTEKQVELAKQRYEVCESCENKKNVVGKFPVCGLCFCPLNKKTFSPKKNSCQINKWNEVDKKFLDILI